MSQHFLLSAKARTLSLAAVLRLSDEEAYQTFKALRWAATDGQPTCPQCGCVTVYEYRTRRIFRCKGCKAQFSLTSGTIFASRKLSLRDLLAAIAIFVNGAKGISALQLGRDLDVQYKTAFVLAHKLREAMAAEAKSMKLSGEVEIDGAYFGGYVKPENQKAAKEAGYRDGRDMSVFLFREWLRGSVGFTQYPERRIALLRRLSELRGKNLACFCPLCDRHRAAGKPLNEHCPDCAPCHVDPLGKAANR